MPILAERQTAHTCSPPVDVIYLISAQHVLYGKELFSVYPIRRPLRRRNPGAENQFSGGFSVYLNIMRTSLVRCDSDFRTMDPFAENNGAAKISEKEPRGRKNFGEKFLGIGLSQERPLADVVNP